MTWSSEMPEIQIPTIHNFKNLIGQTFGRLEVIAYAGKNKTGRVLWKCKCICGNIKIILSQSLTSKKCISCGCYRREIINSMNKNRTIDYTNICPNNTFLIGIKDTGKKTT